MRSVTDIISYKQAKIVHGNARFGDATPREVIDRTVLSFAFGFSAGHTAETIIREHGLLKARRPGQRKPPTLTEKGMEYLRARYGGKLSEIERL